MIRIYRTNLVPQLIEKLSENTRAIEVIEEPQRPDKARKMWQRATIRHDLREVLADMAPGRQYCMYCGDNHGTDVDHFEPIARSPLRTFDWLNHLLACSGCNSHHKGRRFPVDQDGRPLLVDPTTEDPFDHLDLSLSVGEYVPRTDKGDHTIEVCGLNRPLLKRGRMLARYQATACLKEWRLAAQAGDSAGQSIATAAVRDQPFADVCQAMLRQVELPGAERIFTEVELQLLRLPKLRAALLT